MIFTAVIDYKSALKEMIFHTSAYQNLLSFKRLE
jgi:hypothetical protein